MKSKRENTSIKRNFLIICMLCTTGYLAAQDSVCGGG